MKVYQLQLVGFVSNIPGSFIAETGLVTTSHVAAIHRRDELNQEINVHFDARADEDDEYSWAGIDFSEKPEWCIAQFEVQS